jgi:hypothetical protein
VIRYVRLLETLLFINIIQELLHTVLLHPDTVSATWKLHIDVTVDDAMGTVQRPRHYDT